MKDTISRGLNSLLFTVKEHSPSILVVTGVGLSVGAIVAACKETTKAHDILDKMKEDLNDIHVVEDMAKEKDLDYKEDSVKKDMVITYAKTAKNLLVCYGPAIIMEGLSIGFIFSGTNMLKKRNLSLAAAYGVLDTIHREYRENVKTKYGEDVDREMRYGIKAREFKEQLTQKDGSVKEKKVIKDVATKKVTSTNDFTRMFDKVNSVYWRNNARYNRDFIQGVQSDMNLLLRRRGYVFLNDVYAALGLDQTDAGQDVGWVYKDHTKGDLETHHNVIEITPITYMGEEAYDFNKGYEASCILDFNIDGYIRNKIGWSKQ